MMGWFSLPERSNPRDVFPIEQMPLETFGRQGPDALRVLYRKPKALPAPGQRPPQAQRAIERDKEDFFRRILPILDGFDQIFRFSGSSNADNDETISNWLKTMDTLYRRLRSTLEKEGLNAIESMGQRLDLSHHEVVETRYDASVPDNTVIEEVVKGYRYGNRVLRDAKVIVSRSPEKDLIEHQDE